MIFKKKKEVQNNLNNFTMWENDFGFLNLILSRKKGVTKEFLIRGIVSQRVSKSDYLSDTDIEPIVSDCVRDVLNSIGENYKSFLVQKYFGSNESLVKFITEDIYVDLITDSINKNNKKISQNITMQAIEKSVELNKQ